MELTLMFLGGVCVGSIITLCLVYLKSGYGWFRIEPYEDDEDDLYTVKIALKKDQALLKKKQIILKRDDSQQ